jgi:hypothetical protein
MPVLYLTTREEAWIKILISKRGQPDILIRPPREAKDLTVPPAQKVLSWCEPFVYYTQRVTKLDHSV